MQVGHPVLNWNVNMILSNLHMYIFCHSSDPSKNTPDDRWRYQTWLELGGYPYWGEFSTYSGGGYVATFGRNLQAAMRVFDELVEYRWLRETTRAVFVEYLVYNANVNLFGTCMLVVEFLPSGGNNEKCSWFLWNLHFDMT